MDVGGDGDWDGDGGVDGDGDGAGVGDDDAHVEGAPGDGVMGIWLVTSTAP